MNQKGMILMMDELILPEMLKNLMTISRNAGSIILKHYSGSQSDIQIKSDDSPLTLADLESDDYIRRELKERYSTPIISEENFPEYSERRLFSDFFLVDPLDGTKEFIERNGEFTVNIAYIDGKKPVMGVIYAPVIDTLFFAAKGQGSFMMDSNGIQKLPIVNREQAHLTAVGSRKHSTDLDAAFYEMNGIREVVSAGSSLKFCRIAMGMADIYPRFQGSMEWDIAAGHIIASEAGCRVVDLITMQDPLYNKPSLNNNYFFVVRGGVDASSLKIPQIT